VKARKLQQENVTPTGDVAPVSRFTGKEEDVEVGLQYFGKRYLSPYLGRWISLDPLAVHAPGSADLNLYAYVSGAVLKSVDPLGLAGDDKGPSQQAMDSLKATNAATPQVDSPIHDADEAPPAPACFTYGCHRQQAMSQEAPYEAPHLYIRAYDGPQDAPEVQVGKLLGSVAGGMAEGVYDLAKSATKTVACPSCVAFDSASSAVAIAKDPGAFVNALKNNYEELRNDPFATARFIGKVFAPALVGDVAGTLAPTVDTATRVSTFDADALRFSQSNVRNTLPEVTQSMKANGWNEGPIDVVRMPDGGLTAVDNTRVAAASLSGTRVQAIVRGFDELFPAARAGGNLQGSTWGEAITNRLANQRPAWLCQYPMGSPFTGVHPKMGGFSP
jgi:RHS repeat-associated protein